MARGNIYVVTTDPEEIAEPVYRESDYYDCLEALSADYVKENDSIANDADMLLEELKGYGAETGIDDTIKDINGDPVRWVILTEESKRAYFEPRLEKAREYLADLTIEKFMESTPWNTLWMLHDTYGDMFAINHDGTYTFDSGIRVMLCGTKYYISNVIFVH